MQQVLGIHLPPAPLLRRASRLLQQLERVFTEALCAAGCGGAAASAARPDRDRLARAIVAILVATVGPVAAHEIFAEEFVEQAAAATEEGLQRRAEPLLSDQ